MNIDPGFEKKGRKYDQVLKGARDVFVADGFEGASVDQIARAANVSKATLYSYFPDKRKLFAEVVRQECLQQSACAMTNIDTDTPVDQALRTFADHIVSFVASKFGQQIFRICVSEVDRFPEFGQDFYESGPKLVQQTLKSFFQQAVKKNELRIDDFDLAAFQFAELCKAEIFPKMTCGLQQDFSQAEKDRVAAGAVETFMARYGVTEKL